MTSQLSCYVHNFVVIHYNLFESSGSVSMHSSTGIILFMRPPNDRWCYIVTLSPAGWAHTQNDPWQHGRTHTASNSHLQMLFSIVIKIPLKTWFVYFILEYHIITLHCILCKFSSDKFIRICKCQIDNESARNGLYQTGDKPITKPTWTTRMSVFWGYPLPYYPYYWVILDAKSKQHKVKVTNLKNLPKF